MEEKKKVNTGINYKNKKWRPSIFIDADKRESIERWFTDKGYRTFNEYVIADLFQNVNVPRIIQTYRNSIVLWYVSSYELLSNKTAYLLYLLVAEMWYS